MPLKEIGEESMISLRQSIEMMGQNALLTARVCLGAVVAYSSYEAATNDARYGIAAAGAAALELCFETFSWRSKRESGPDLSIKIPEEGMTQDHPIYRKLEFRTKGR